MPKKYAKHGRKKRKLNPRQQKFVEGLAAGKTQTQAAIDAGYTDKRPNQAGYQALAQLRGRVPQLLEKYGIGEDALIDKYLLPLLNAYETKFFKEGAKRINVEALSIRLAALRTCFELHGSYAPRDPREAAEFGVKVINVNIPRPTNEWQQFVDVIPEHALTRHSAAPGTNGKPHANGNPPAVKKNGDAP